MQKLVSCLDLLLERLDLTVLLIDDHIPSVGLELLPVLGRLGLHTVSVGVDISSVLAVDILLEAVLHAEIKSLAVHESERFIELVKLDLTYKRSVVLGIEIHERSVLHIIHGDGEIRHPLVIDAHDAVLCHDKIIEVRIDIDNGI